MKIALILCPHMSLGVPPTNLAALKSYLQREGHEVRAWDLNFEFYQRDQGPHRDFIWNEHAFHLWGKPAFDEAFLSRFSDEWAETAARILDWKPDIAGLSVNRWSAGISAHLSSRLKRKRPDLKIIWGGWDCYEMDGRPQEHIRQPWLDAVCVTEGEVPLAAYARALRAAPDRPAACPGLFLKGKDGVIVPPSGESAAAVLDDLPFLDYSSFNPNDYPRPYMLGLNASRGCVRRCKFCEIPLMMEGFRHMSGKRMWDEIEHQVRHFRRPFVFNFYDAMINGDLAELESFCDRMIAGRLALSMDHYGSAIGQGQSFFPVTWMSYCMFERRMSRSLFAKMAQSGCCRASFGLESAAPHVLRDMRKGFLVEHAHEALTWAGQVRLPVHLNVIVGWPSETRDDMETTLRFLKEHRGTIGAVTLTLTTLAGPMRESCAEVADLEGAHSTYWATIDGANNFPERLFRMRYMKDAIQAMGIDCFLKGGTHTDAGFKVFEAEYRDYREGRVPQDRFLAAAQNAVAGAAPCLEAGAGA
ncbi:MAG: B12-binding domain-containing radical SAM protein [Elusimicrobiota bacterium]